MSTNVDKYRQILDFTIYDKFHHPRRELATKARHQSPPINVPRGTRATKALDSSRTANDKLSKKLDLFSDLRHSGARPPERTQVSPLNNSKKNYKQHTMPIQGSITIYKRMLASSTKTVEEILTELQENEIQLKTLSTTLAGDISTQTLVQNSLRKLEGGILALIENSANLQSALHEFTAKFEELHPTSPNVEEEMEKYLSTLEETLAKSRKYIGTLRGRISEFKEYTERSQIAKNLHMENTRDDAVVNTTDVKKFELPSIPIPTFSGDIWDWDNFWELFNLNIRSQTLPELQKFNYLINSLKGVPLQAIKNYQITEENYGKAIEFLTKKYGNPKELIVQLLEKLEKSTLQSPVIHEQRKLLEQIQVIISQLVQKEENINNHSMYQKILSKFPRETQRKVLDKKINTKDRPYNMDELLQHLEDVISNEEWILRNISSSNSTSNNFGNKNKQWRLPPATLSCMYCRGNHKPFYCDEYKTPQERSQYLLQNKLCYICASARHNTYQCTKPSCYKCQKRHHTSCCLSSTPQNNAGKKTLREPQKRANSRKRRAKSRKKYKKHQSRTQQ